MRLKSVLILIVLCLSVISLSAVTASASPFSNGTFLITLDVCHASNPAVSANSDMPCLHEISTQPFLLEYAGAYNSLDQLLGQFVSISQKDRPPKV